MTNNFFRFFVVFMLILGVIISFILSSLYFDISFLTRVETDGLLDFEHFLFHAGIGLGFFLSLIGFALFWISDCFFDRIVLKIISFKNRKK